MWKAHVLVVANVTADSDELLSALSTRAEQGAARFTLLVPATGGGSAGRAGAESQLAKALHRMRGAGLEVEGVIGDADPVTAVHENWDPAKFDEVIVSTLPTHASRWLQIDLPRRLGKITGVGCTHVVAAEERPAIEATHLPEPERRGVLSPLTVLGWGGHHEEPERQAQRPAPGNATA